MAAPSAEQNAPTSTTHGLGQQSWAASKAPPWLAPNLHYNHVASKITNQSKVTLIVLITDPRDISPGL